jgi:large subunit ribosomal protein L53
MLVLLGLCQRAEECGSGDASCPENHVTLSTLLASELKVFGSALRCTLAVDRARRDDPAGGMPLRQLTKVRIQFAASDQRSAAVREFLKRCQAARESNPECVLEHRVRSDDAPPVVAVEYVNGFKDQFNCHKMNVEQIAQRIRDVANGMETTELLKQAGLDSASLDLKGFVRGKTGAILKE